MLEKETTIFKKFRAQRVLVIGELIVDAYFQGNCNRIAPEATVPVIDVLEKKYCLGGAANVAANLNALGAQVSFISVCGDDEHAVQAFELLIQAGLSTSQVLRSNERKTLYKTRVSSDSQCLIRFDEGSVDAISEHLEDQLMRSLEQIYPEIDAVFIADYGKGMLSERLIRKMVELNSRQPKVIALDTKRNQSYLALKPTVVKPNYAEASKLMGNTGSLQASLLELEHWGQKLYEKTAATYVLLTLDARGVCAFEKGKFKFHVPVPEVQNPSVSGAGDTFLATAMLAIVSKAGLEITAALAVAAAQHVVEQPHTAVCELDELMRKIVINGKLLEGKSAIQQVRVSLIKSGKKIVFTNGCFDILHSGHVRYLRGAKAAGDILIVGLNTDESIKRLKGTGRPINNLKDRIEVLSELSCIDYIIPFGKPGDDTPIGLVQQIRPNIFVKGGDYRDKFLPEEQALKKIGCEIVFLPMVADRSTTNTISKIRENTAFAAPLAIN